jgi:hypothetical protein
MQLKDEIALLENSYTFSKAHIGVVVSFAPYK